MAEHMSAASREASSLKEEWRSILYERETMLKEVNALSCRVTDLTETIRRLRSGCNRHSNDQEQMKILVEKFEIELKETRNTIGSLKKTITSRDSELERRRTENREIRGKISLLNIEYEKLKVDMEYKKAQIKELEKNGDRMKTELEKTRTESRDLQRKTVDLQSRICSLENKLESATDELATSKERCWKLEQEQEEYLKEKDRLEEALKRAEKNAEELFEKQQELTGRYNGSQTDLIKHKELLRIAEQERDALRIEVSDLRRVSDDKEKELDRNRGISSGLSLEKMRLERELSLAKNKFAESEKREDELKKSLNQVLEGNRLVVIERDQLQEELRGHQNEVDELKCRIDVQDESILRQEEIVAKLRTENHTLTERVNSLVCESEQNTTKIQHLESELKEAKEKFLVVQKENIRLIAVRDRCIKEANEWKCKYEEYYEAGDDGTDLEFEIESLRTLLREARDQKERAISARQTADRERDEYATKYEEKCREMERSGESKSGFFYSQGKGDGRLSYSRTVSSGTTLHHDKHENGISGQGIGMFALWATICSAHLFKNSA